jgi:hypothetical protein
MLLGNGGEQASALGGIVQMYSAQTPDFLNGINTPLCGDCKLRGLVAIVLNRVAHNRQGMQVRYGIEVAQ